ncbi:MAG: tetratricopeptide repeat protein, partial [Armatimonadota bacterium]|nr:tetratricopeptide repeat protein [Armatimonadota bacterium]
VEASIQLSYDLLDANLQSRWRSLAVFPDTFDGAGAAAVWAVDTDAATDALGDLLAFSMVEWNEVTRRYRLHDLARDFAAAHLSENEAESYAAQKRHATHYEQVLRRSCDLFLEGHDAILCGLKLFDDERANIEAGQSWAATHAGQDEEAARLCMNYLNAGAYVLQLRQRPRERMRYLEASIYAAQRLQDREAEGSLLVSLGIAWRNVGEPRRAIEFHEQGLEIARAIGCRQVEGSALGNIGLAYADLGEPSRSMKFYEDWLAIVRETGYRRGESNALGRIGNAYATLGDLHRAIEFYEQQLTIAREISDPRGESNAIGNLGRAYADLGNLAHADEFYKKQLEIARKIGYRRGEGNALWNMSLALDELGERAQATELAAAALRIYEQIEDPNAARVRRRLAEWRG